MTNWLRGHFRSINFSPLLPRVLPGGTVLVVSFDPAVPLLNHT
jgi:hypothetical protein